MSKSILKTLPALLLLFWVCGCRTYFGYDDEISTVESRVGEAAEYDRLRSCILTVGNDRASVQLYESYKQKSTLEKKRVLVGYRHYYANFDSKDTNPALVKIEWFPLTGEKFKKNPWALGNAFMNGLNKNNGPLVNLVGFCIGLGLLGCDLCINLMFCPMVDFCITGCQLMWNMFSSPCHWFWTRSFYGFDDWNLRQHNPGILTMLAYMPGINLFFPFWTPPYLNKRSKFSELEKLPSPRTLKSQLVHSISEKERALADKKLTITLYDTNGKKLASVIKYSDSRGQLDIKDFLTRAAARAVGKHDEFRLALKFDGNVFEKMIPARACWRKEHLRDWLVFNDRRFDFRMRIAAFVRSSRYWQVDKAELLRKYPEMQSLLQYVR